MPCAEAIVLALVSARKAREAASCAKGVEIFPSSGEYFMYVALMPDVPDKVVAWQVENSVQCNGKLYNAEI